MICPGGGLGGSRARPPVGWAMWDGEIFPRAAPSGFLPPAPSPPPKRPHKGRSGPLLPGQGGACLVSDLDRRFECRDRRTIRPPKPSLDVNKQPVFFLTTWPNFLEIISTSTSTAQPKRPASEMGQSNLPSCGSVRWRRAVFITRTWDGPFAAGTASDCDLRHLPNWVGNGYGALRTLQFHWRWGLLQLPHQLIARHRGRL